jgi:hypothetical protein
MTNGKGGNGIWPPPWLAALALTLTAGAAAAAFADRAVLAGILATMGAVLQLAAFIRR